MWLAPSIVHYRGGLEADQTVHPEAVEVVRVCLRAVEVGSSAAPTTRKYQIYIIIVYVYVSM